MANDRSDRLITGMFRDRDLRGTRLREYEPARKREQGRGTSRCPTTPARAVSRRMTRCETELARRPPRAWVSARWRAAASARSSPAWLRRNRRPDLPIIAMGPLAAASAGAAGGGAGAVAGAFIGVGIPEERAKPYERGIDEGGIALGVTPWTDEDSDYFEREWTDAVASRSTGQRRLRQGGDRDEDGVSRNGTRRALVLAARAARGS